jgi:hypothetical protein
MTEDDLEPYEQLILSAEPKVEKPKEDSGSGARGS